MGEEPDAANMGGGIPNIADIPAEPMLDDQNLGSPTEVTQIQGDPIQSQGGGGGSRA
jgi:hypothetical protein